MSGGYRTIVDTITCSFEQLSMYCENLGSFLVIIKLRL